MDLARRKLAAQIAGLQRQIASMPVFSAELNAELDILVCQHNECAFDTRPGPNVFVYLDNGLAVLPRNYFVMCFVVSAAALYSDSGHLIDIQINSRVLLQVCRFSNAQHAAKYAKHPSDEEIDEALKARLADDPDEWAVNCDGLYSASNLECKVAVKFDTENMHLAPMIERASCVLVPRYPMHRRSFIDV
jgi:hypothetical protein